VRTETMIAGAVAAASFYNSYATGQGVSFFSDNPHPAESTLPHLPFDFWIPGIMVFIGSSVAFVALGIGDIANAARENPHRKFEPLKLRRH